MNDFSREREAWLDHQENLKRLAEKPIKPLFELAIAVIGLVGCLTGIAVIIAVCRMLWW